ncbi:MAG: hypothetical protein C4563_01390 [Desulfobulbus sp.]|jgi:hypothetical protein|nr:MAG: hypothetical protein C4563_01390 [Desulfobulbus sp.]
MSSAGAPVREDGWPPEALSATLGKDVEGILDMLIIDNYCSDNILILKIKGEKQLRSLEAEKRR